MRKIGRPGLSWRPALLLALVGLGVLWVMAFDRCIYDPGGDQTRTASGCFIGSLIGIFAGLYLSAAAVLGWLLNLMGGR